MPRFIDHSGHRFGRLTITSRAQNKGVKTRWNFICDCGNTGVAFASDLTKGRHKSCGCLQVESVQTHGATSKGQVPQEYRTWINMKSRCYNPNGNHYDRYGARGITVCDRWRDSFENFIEDMGTKPTPAHTIERIDNNGNYEPGNCRWATRKEQANNRTHNIKWQHRRRRADGTFS